MSSESTPFQTFRETAEQQGAEAVLDQLAENLRTEKKYAQLYDALLMKKRHQLGLPLEGTDSLRDLPEEVQTEIERATKWGKQLAHLLE